MYHIRISGTDPSSVILSQSKIEKVPRYIRRAKSGKITTSSGKGLVSTSRTYACPKGTGPGFRRSKRPLSAKVV